MKLDAQWITGFVDGEGCFYVGIQKCSGKKGHPDMSAGYQVLPEFTVVQHERDAKVLHAMKDYFGCGVVRKNHDDRMAYRVRGMRHLIERIVPFFVKHPLKSTKRANFEKFRRIVRMMETGDHLTAQGIAKIRQIAGRMNRGQSR